MDAVAVQIANTFAFGTGGKGRRGETFLGKGKSSGITSRQEENPDDWPCSCGLKVWARKPECPVCKQKRPRDMEVKEQPATQGSHPPPTQQPVGTEEDATKAEEARKRGQLKHIAKTIAGWPEDQRDGVFFKSMVKEAETLKAGLVSAQPSDTQLLGAKEEVNTTMRRVLKSEKKRDQIMKDLTTAKDEVAASRASNSAAVGRLEALEKALRSMSVEAHPDPIVTLQELEMLKQMRAMKAKPGPGGAEAYKKALADIADWYGSDQGPLERGKGSSAPATPEAPAGAHKNQAPEAGGGPRSPLPKPDQAGNLVQDPGVDHRRLGPAAEMQAGGRKRGAAEEAGAYQRKQEAIASGAAMEEDFLDGAAAVPGCMTQPEGQASKPMQVDDVGGGELSQEEKEQWAASERARERDLGLELDEEEAAAQAAAQDHGSPSKARPAKGDKAARRAASKSPYRKKEGEGEEDPDAPLESVREEADTKKVPSDDEGEEAEKEEADQ